MLNLFTSSKKRLEQRMMKLCLNTEKTPAMAATNSLGRADWMVQPVAKLDDAEPLALNVLAINILERADRSPGAALVQPLTVFVSRKRRP